MKDRLASVYHQDTEEQKVSAVADSKAIIDELRQSDETAEVRFFISKNSKVIFKAILDRERKKQIEIDLEEKEKALERKRQQRGFDIRYVNSFSFQSSCKVEKELSKRLPLLQYKGKLEKVLSTSLSNFLLMVLRFPRMKSWNPLGTCITSKSLVM